MRFILFDIDGTLIDSGGAGTRALNLAFQEIFSVADAFRTITMAGKTDLQILREGLALHGIDASNGVVPEFFKAYIRHLKNHIGNNDGHVKKGVRESLEILGSDGEFLLGILTGNIEAGARIKLAFFGLDAYFGIGAYGDEHEDRQNLLPLAVDTLYARRRLRVDFSDCVVVGDTPRDVLCAKPYGAFSVAVATGPYPAETLRKSGADVVLEDLSDTAGFVSILRTSSRKTI